MINSLSPSESLLLGCPVDKTPTKFMKTPLLNWPTQPQPKNTKALHLRPKINVCALSSPLSFCLCPASTRPWSHTKVCHIHFWKLWITNFSTSIPLWPSVESSSTLGLDLINDHLTKSELPLTFLLLQLCWWWRLSSFEILYIAFSFKWHFHWA